MPKYAPIRNRRLTVRIAYLPKVVRMNYDLWRVLFGASRLTAIRRAACSSLYTLRGERYPWHREE